MKYYNKFQVKETFLTILPKIGDEEITISDGSSEEVEVNTNDITSKEVISYDNLPKNFSVVKMMTNNGEKIGMCYTEDVSEYGIPLQNNLDFHSACELVPTLASGDGLIIFDNINDKIIGHIPVFMIGKKSKSTSYKN